MGTSRSASGRVCYLDGERATAGVDQSSGQSGLSPSYPTHAEVSTWQRGAGRHVEAVGLDELPFEGSADDRARAPELVHEPASGVVVAAVCAEEALVRSRELGGTVGGERSVLLVEGA